MTLCQRIIASRHKTRQHQTKMKSAQSNVTKCKDQKKTKKRTERTEEGKNCVLTGKILCILLFVCSSAIWTIKCRVVNMCLEFFFRSLHLNWSVSDVPSINIKFFFLRYCHRIIALCVAFDDDNHYHNHETWDTRVHRRIEKEIASISMCWPLKWQNAKWINWTPAPAPPQLTTYNTHWMEIVFHKDIIA